MIPRILSIAGSDSGGGAGIQADIKTISALGGYAMTAVTAVTAQNTQGVFGVYDIPEAFIAEQIDLVLSDIGADVIKCGMLHSRKVIEIVDYVLQSYKNIPIVIDPVMVAKGGALLLERDAIETLIQTLISQAVLVTPNIPEAEILADRPIRHIEDMQQAAQTLREYGAQAVLVKGGHLSGDIIYDVLIDEQGKEFVYTSRRIVTRHTHGTGCTLSSAIAYYMGCGMPLQKSVMQAREYVFTAIKHAPQLGQGHGPLDHHANYRNVMQNNHVEYGHNI